LRRIRSWGFADFNDPKSIQQFASWVSEFKRNSPFCGQLSCKASIRVALTVEQIGHR